MVGFHGFDIYNATHHSRYGNLPGCTTDNITPTPELLNRWIPEHEKTNIPLGFKQHPKGIVKGAFSDRYIENGSFIEIRKNDLFLY